MSDPKTQMILGGVKFVAGKSAYDQLEEHFVYKWNTIERAADRPILQFQAEMKKTIQLTGTLSTLDSGLNSFED